MLWIFLLGYHGFTWHQHNQHYYPPSQYYPQLHKSKFNKTRLNNITIDKFPFPSNFITMHNPQFANSQQIGSFSQMCFLKVFKSKIPKSTKLHTNAFRLAYCPLVIFIIFMNSKLLYSCTCIYHNLSF